MSGEEWLCTKAVPQALAPHGHDWESGGLFGVIVGVSRCRNCQVTSSTRHFVRPATAASSPPSKSEVGAK